MSAEVVTYAAFRNAARYAAYRRRAADVEAADPLAFLERVLAGVEARRALLERDGSVNDPADPDQFAHDYAALSRGY